MELDRIPLWRGDHVAVKQLVEDFARYSTCRGSRSSGVLLEAIRDGVALLTWEQDGFAFADSYDESAGRYRGLRGGQQVSLIDASTPGLLVKPEVARRSWTPSAWRQPPGATPPGPAGAALPERRRPGPGAGATEPGSEAASPVATQPKRYHGTVTLDPTRVGRDASRIADEVIAHLAGLVGARVTVTLEIEAEIPAGAPDNVVRTVTENSRTLKFTARGLSENRGRRDGLPGGRAMGWRMVHGRATMGKPSMYASRHGRPAKGAVQGFARKEPMPACYVISVAMYI